ncbi:MAG: hypothetical protein U1E39_15325 [Planctomycetota bacterium]
MVAVRHGVGARRGGERGGGLVHRAHAHEGLGERQERRVGRRPVGGARRLGVEPLPGVAPDVRGVGPGLGRHGAPEPRERLGAAAEPEQQAAEVAVDRHRVAARGERATVEVGGGGRGARALLEHAREREGLARARAERDRAGLGPQARLDGRAHAVAHEVGEAAGRPRAPRLEPERLEPPPRGVVAGAAAGRGPRRERRRARVERVLGGGARGRLERAGARVALEGVATRDERRLAPHEARPRGERALGGGPHGVVALARVRVRERALEVGPRRGRARPHLADALEAIGGVAARVRAQDRRERTVGQRVHRAAHRLGACAREAEFDPQPRPLRRGDVEAARGLEEALGLVRPRVAQGALGGRHVVRQRRERRADRGRPERRALATLPQARPAPSQRGEHRHQGRAMHGVTEGPVTGWDDDGTQR